MGQAIAGVSGSIATLFSLWNVSAPTGLWITMNQFQLIMLLLLTKSNIPKSIVSYLSGLKATTWSFNFIPFKEIPGFDKIVNGLDFRLPDVELKYFGINSGSTFANNFSLICILFIFIAIHSLFLLIHRLLKSKVKSKKIWVKFLEKTFQFFAFSLYIRVMLEANVFLLLSSFSELYHWDTSSLSKIISIYFAFTWGWICFTIISLSLVNYSIHKDTQNIDNYIPFKEFLTGVKETRMSRLYPTILLLRRFLFIGLLIFGQSLNSFELICPMIIIQLAYLVNLAIVRPYKKVRDNVIEVTNEWFYLVLISLLSHFNSKDRWISAIENIYFGIILSNSMSIIFILIGTPVLIHIFKHLNQIHCLKWKLTNSFSCFLRFMHSKTKTMMKEKKNTSKRTSGNFILFIKMLFEDIRLNNFTERSG